MASLIAPRPAELNSDALFGELRSFESAPPKSMSPRALDAELARLSDGLDVLASSRPDLVHIARARLRQNVLERVERGLEWYGWRVDKENATASQTFHEPMKRDVRLDVRLDACLAPTLELTSPHASRLADRWLVPMLGVVVGFEHISATLACLRAEFAPKGTFAKLSESQIRLELARRRDHIVAIAHTDPDAPGWMQEVCTPEDYALWVSKIGDPHDHYFLDGGEASCFVEDGPKGRFYRPCLSVQGSMGEECSCIFTARHELFSSSEEARAWARARLDEPLAYYALHPDFEFAFTGKTLANYS